MFGWAEGQSRMEPKLTSVWIQPPLWINSDRTSIWFLICIPTLWHCLQCGCLLSIRGDINSFSLHSFISFCSIFDFHHLLWWPPHHQQSHLSLASGNLRLSLWQWFVSVRLRFPFCLRVCRPIPVITHRHPLISARTFQDCDIVWGCSPLAPTQPVMTDFSMFNLAILRFCQKNFYFFLCMVPLFCP